MKVQADSLTFVVVGDWNKFYLDPSWLAHKVFELDEVGVELSLSPGSGTTVVLRDSSCALQPSSSRFMLTCSNLQQNTLERFSDICARLIKNAVSPFIQAYGFNIKMIETEESPFTGLLDSLPDSDKLAEIDAFIETASVSRKIRYQGVLLNITHSIDDKGILNVSINEHTDCNRSSDQIVLPDQSASGFIRRVFFLLESTGLKIEQEGD